MATAFGWRHRHRKALKRRRLQVETLEHRFLMAAIPPFTLPAEPADDSVFAGAPASAAPLEADAAQAAMAAMESGLERFQSLQDIKDHLLADAIERYRDLFGRETEPWWSCAVTCDSMSAMATLRGEGQSMAPESTIRSDTNTQVTGVDEADLVETDGRYLYTLSHGALVIVDLQQTAAPSIAARMPISDKTASMYLWGDRLTLISQEYCGSPPEWYYGNNCWVTVIDISDRTSPEVIERTSLEGQLVDSRAIGDRVYVVMNTSRRQLPGPTVVQADGMPLGDWWRQEPDAVYRYETEQEYRTRIASILDRDALPLFRSLDADGNEVARGSLADPTQVYKPCQSDHHYSSTAVAVIDVDAGIHGPIESISLQGCFASHLYVSEESLYLLGPEPGTETSIRKIALSGEQGRLQCVAAGTVNGSILDQFSVDEHDGLLRVATTTWHRGEPDNQLAVLQQRGTSLEIVGSIRGLAPGERIYSARFQDDQAFVVTYRSFDPLFAIDLSNPAAPSVVGELEIPGFSNYLQLIPGGLLVGVGRIVPHDLYRDPQVSLFDVNDLGNPQLLDRSTIPAGRKGGLHVFDDHHRIAYYPESGILSVSVPADHRVEGGCSGVKNDLYVFQIDTGGASARLIALGKIEHEDSVFRSIQLGNRLISISEESIEVHELTRPEVTLARLEIDETDVAPLAKAPSEPWITTLPVDGSLWKTRPLAPDPGPGTSPSPNVPVDSAPDAPSPVSAPAPTVPIRVEPPGGEVGAPLPEPDRPEATVPKEDLQGSPPATTTASDADPSVAPAEAVGPVPVPSATVIHAKTGQPASVESLLEMAPASALDQQVPTAPSTRVWAPPVADPGASEEVELQAAAFWAQSDNLLDDHAQAGRSLRPAVLGAALERRFLFSQAGQAVCDEQFPVSVKPRLRRLLLW